MKGTKGIVLAGGKGRRMHSDLPKVLTDVNHRPMIYYSIDVLLGLEVEEIIIVTGHMREMVEERVRDYRKEGIRFVHQQEQKGTGHAVMQAEELFEGFEGYVYIIYGDMLTL